MSCNSKTDYFFWKVRTCGYFYAQRFKKMNNNSNFTPQSVQPSVPKSIVSGLTSLDSTEIVQLENIANKCPLDGGQGVFVARSILVQLGEYEYDDRQLCQIVEEREGKRKEPEQKAGFYPNPASSEITLIIPANKVCKRVSISNSLGQVLLIEKLPVNGHSIDLSGFANGIFILEFDFIDSTEIQKIIKN